MYNTSGVGGSFGITISGGYTGPSQSGFHGKLIAGMTTLMVAHAAPDNTRIGSRGDYYEWWSNNDGWTDILVSGPLCRDTAFSESLTGLGSTRGICIGRQTARYDHQYSMGSRL